MDSSPSRSPSPGRRGSSESPSTKLMTTSIKEKVSQFENRQIVNTEVDIIRFIPKMKPVSPEKSKIPIPIPEGPEIHAEEYPMNHERRGKALIFNHSSFQDPKKYRRGSQVDGNNLIRAFTSLGFQVDVCEDYKKEEVLDKLDRVSREDHTKADCLVVVVMTHGNPGTLHAYDGSYKESYLWKAFTGDNCPTLAGKPKLFFIQACRGDQTDSGTKLSARITTMTDGPKPKATYTIPTVADLLICYATYEGQYAWRDVEAGSWFVQALCREVNENGTKYDILRIMTNVNRRVAIQFQSRSDRDSMNNKKQMSNFTSTLTRMLYFKPKSPKSVR